MTADQWIALLTARGLVARRSDRLADAPPAATWKEEERHWRDEHVRLAGDAAHAHRNQHDAMRRAYPDRPAHVGCYFCDHAPPHAPSRESHLVKVGLTLDFDDGRTRVTVDVTTHDPRLLLMALGVNESAGEPLNAADAPAEPPPSRSPE